MALDALENHTAIKHPQQIHYRDSATEALRAALAEPNKCTHGVTDGNCKECYMTEPEQEPLTDEEIEVLAMDIDGTPKIYLEFARDIEWVHGIKGKS